MEFISISFSEKKSYLKRINYSVLAGWEKSVSRHKYSGPVDKKRVSTAILLIELFIPKSKINLLSRSVSPAIVRHNCMYEYSWIVARQRLSPSSPFPHGPDLRKSFPLFQTNFYIHLLFKMKLSMRLFLILPKRTFCNFIKKSPPSLPWTRPSKCFIIHFFCLSWIYVCVLAYSCLTVHLGVAKFAYPTTHPYICDMLFAGVKSLNDRFGNCVLYAYSFFSLIQKSPIHFFCPSQMHVCALAYASSIVHLCMAKFVYVIMLPYICNTLFGSLTFHLAHLTSLIQFFRSSRMYVCAVACVFLIVHWSIAKSAYATTHPCIWRNLYVTYACELKQTSVC